jgi:hypothetical protein
VSLIEFEAAAPNRERERGVTVPRLLDLVSLDADVAVFAVHAHGVAVNLGMNDPKALSGLLDGERSNGRSGPAPPPGGSGG